MNQVFIIEHLEPEVFPWCLIEYKHVSQIVGKENIWFCNLVGKRGASALAPYGRCLLKSVRTLAPTLKNACVLDPAAKKTLGPKECGVFEYFIFGGILGDYPPRQRTKEELTPLLPRATVRNIGKEQMSTDNAVLVVHEIIQGKKLKDLQFQDGIEIEINNVESVQLPYRYRIINRAPFVSPELILYLKEKKGF